MKKLTQAEITHVQDTLARARLGRASLSELGASHDLAADAGLTATATELRWHVRRMVAEPSPHTAARDVFAGVVSGILTHHLLR
jgi:hypothetical protein